MKLIKLTCLFSILFSLSVSQSFAKPNISITPAKSGTKKNVSKYDFRKANWGMTQQQVYETEKKEPVFQDENMVVFQDNLLDSPVKVAYFFEKGKLIKAAYQIKINIVDYVENILIYKKLKSSLREKYGVPKVDNNPELKEIKESDKATLKHLSELLERSKQDFKMKWEMERTEIFLILKGKDIYSDQNLKLNI